ncbi:hypothetical protein KUTeg_009599 [Tegillarca granosa]|uniref:Guanylyl cyclase n=1 Tax=Tegillarca granosa TaxID=220873 RepID=A0ABQ9F6N7_TEGGR|nr:hypothetical protein KUTeg_009599 [Tegillarca granosa]
MAGLKDEVKEHIQLTVPTCIQTYTWDCGLACACMVLRYIGINDYYVYTSDLEELRCGESIWTIDLAFLLNKYRIRLLFTTITLGVDKGYSKKKYNYGRNNQSSVIRKLSDMFSKLDLLRGRNCLSCFRNCCSTYQGHYVVVCGYDRKKKNIYYKNPSYDEVCKTDHALQNDKTR